MEKLVVYNDQKEERCAISYYEGSTAYEILETFCRLMLAMGYHPNSVKDAVLSMAEEYEDLEIKNKEEE